jgi:hypothetical protein
VVSNPAASDETLNALGRIDFTLRVGVTGHRWLKNEQNIGEVVDEALNRLLETLLENLPSSLSHTELRFVVVSALAEGADRLVVNRCKEHGAELEVILPFDAKTYKETFRTTESAADFDYLRHEARWVTVIPTSKVEAHSDLEGGFDETRIWSPDAARRRAYLEAGHETVNNCDVLIALWDGAPARGVGGTAEIVKYAIDQGVPLIWIRTDGSNRMSVQIGDTSATWQELCPLGKDDFTLLDTFNRGSRFRRGTDPPSLFSNSSVKSDLASVLPLEDTEHWIGPYFARSSNRADLFQNLFTAASLTVIGGAFVAVALVSAQAVFQAGEYWLSGIEIAALVLLTSALAIGRSFHFHEQWAASRYLAESFRSSGFLAIVGVEQGQTSRQGGTSRSGSPDAWHRRAYREVWRCRRRPRVDLEGHQVGPAQRLLADDWIGGQIDYHLKKSKRYHRNDRITKTALWFLLFLSLVAAALHIIFRVIHPGASAENWSEYVAIIAPAGIAAVAAIGAQRDYRQHEDRYRQMVRRLKEYYRALNGVSDVNSVQRLALEIERTTREEGGEWLGLVRLHDLEPA